MFPVSGNQNKASFPGGLLHNSVNFGHKRTGRIHTAHAAALRFLQNSARNAVGTNHQHAFPRLGRFLRNPYTARLERCKGLRVVDDGTKRPHAFSFVKQPVHRLYGPIYTEAEASRFCHSNLQCFSSNKVLISFDSLADARLRPPRAVSPPKSSPADMGEPKRTVTRLRKRSSSPSQ